MKFLTLLIVVISINANAQLTNSVSGARSAGMANASINLTDVWAIDNNVAGLSEAEGTNIGVFTQNRFGMTGFNTVSFVGAHELEFGSAGISMKRFGDDLYNETSLGLGFAHKLDFISLGAKLNLLQVSIQELGSKQSVALEVGGIVHVNDELVFGLNIYNFNQAKLATYNDERFSTVLKAGVTYHPYEKLYATIETEKDTEYKHNVKAGVEYYVIDKLAIRTGFTTLNRLSTFGLGLKLTKFQVDYAINYHSQLGISNNLSLNYIIRNNKSSEPIEVVE